MTEPATKSCLLPSAGIRRATRHVYKRSGYVTDSAGVPIAVEHIFECRETGALRRWGYEEIRP